MGKGIFKRSIFIIVFFMVVLIGSMITDVIAASKPDLVVSNIFLKEHAYGNKCRIMITMKNIGHGYIPNVAFNQSTVLLLQDNYIRGGYKLSAVDPSHTLKSPGSTLTFPWNAILLKPGTYHFGAKADGNNKITEENEGNNQLSPRTLICRGSTSAGKPDLVITSFGLKKWGQCKPNHAVMTFQVTIKNIGNAASPNIGNKALVQVMDQHSIRNAANWGNGAIVGSIAPGASKTVDIPVYYLKANPAHMVNQAPHPFRAVVDPANLVNESNEHNNKSGIINVGAPRNCIGIPSVLPDLTITDVSLDNRCNVQVAVRNVGRGPVPNDVWTVHTPKSAGVYLYRDGRGWGGETIWHFDPGKGLQRPGGSAVYHSSLKVQNKTRIKAIVDMWNRVKESNERNNVKTQVLKCKRVALPDLVVRDIRLVQGCKMQVTIANIGRGGVPRSGYDMHHGVGIQMYNNNNPWGGIRLGAVDPHGRLASPGGAVSFLWFPGARNLNLHPGKNRIKLIVDNNNAVRESNEGNNVLLRTLSCPAYPKGATMMPLKLKKLPVKPNQVLPNEKVKGQPAGPMGI